MPLADAMSSMRMSSNPTANPPAADVSLSARPGGTWRGLIDRAAPSVSPRCLDSSYKRKRAVAVNGQLANQRRHMLSPRRAPGEGSRRKDRQRGANVNSVSGRVTIGGPQQFNNQTQLTQLQIY